MSNLSRRQFLWSSAIAGATPALAQKNQAAPQPPNVLLIVAEDLASWMCGCYGNREIRTPNIDLLARLGTRVQDAFAMTPAGSPGRATLLTGRTTMQHGVQDQVTDAAAVPASFSNETLLSDLLSARGYNCGYAGLWDLGDYRKPGHGIDFTYTVGPGVTYRDPTVSRNGADTSEQGYLTDLITKAGVDYIGQQAAGKPFFLTLSYPNPRGPYDAHPAEYYDMYAGTDFETIGWLPKADNAHRGEVYLDDTVASIRKFAAGVTALDAQIPILQRQLRDQKLRADTLIFFTSVSGNLLGRHGLWGGGRASNPPNMFDDTLRVPMVAAWPGKMPVEGTRPELVSLYDLFPTILDMCGVEAPSGRNLCGLSHSRHSMNQAIPKGEADWPSHVYGYYGNTRMVRDKRFKVIVRNGGDGPNEFYNFSRDPRELRNEWDNLNIVTVRDRMAAMIDPWVERYSK